MLLRTSMRLWRILRLIKMIGVGVDIGFDPDCDPDSDADPGSFRM